MPPPPATFTKSKWLTFFAELTAKITHHNVNVVIEGCEIYRRLVISRVSIGAFLEEGSFLEHMLNVACAMSQGEKPPTSRDREMQHCVMQCISLTLDMMTSLFADGDSYHILLVLARSRLFLDSLTQVLKGKNRDWFGYTCKLLQVLLSLPLTAPRERLQVEEGVAAVRHVRALEDSLVGMPHALQHLFDVSTGLFAVTAGPVQLACYGVAKHTIQHLAGTDLGAWEASNAATLQTVVFHELIRGSYGKFGQAKCHADCIAAFNDLWCCYVFNPEATSLLTGADEARQIQRFLTVAPQNSNDEVIFRGSLAWFALLVSSQPITVELQQLLLNLCGTSLIPLLGVSTSTNKAVLEKPSSAQAILTFLLTMVPCCPSIPMQKWLSTGILAHLERFIRDAQGLTSRLVDAPSVVEGTLPDELYLSCAMSVSKSDLAVLAVTAMKLLCHLLQHHSRTLLDVFAAESLALVQTLAPLCAQLVINNPTLQAPPNHIFGGTLLHHYPKCQRSCRPTSIGECAAVTLDACFDLSCDIPPELTRELVRLMPNLLRATKESVQPHLRATTTRCLLRLIKTCGDIVIVVKEIPSLIPAAISSVLGFDAASPPWEVAGSAELLRHIINIAADDRSVDESLHISQSSLPLQLLQLLAKNTITYPTAALMNLLTGVAEQQARLAYKGYQFQSVLYPHGSQSVPQWTHLIKLCINANVTLSKVLRKVPKMTTAIKDSLARATAAFEELSIQFSYTSSTLCALRQILSNNPTIIELIDPELLSNLIASVVVVPPPYELASAIGARYSVDISQSGILQRSYEEMITCLAGFVVAYYTTSASLTFAALPAEFSNGVVTILNTDTISTVSRTHLCRGLSAILKLSDQQYPHVLQSLESEAKTIFMALLDLADSDPVRATRALMLTTFPAAVIAACTTGWLASVIQSAHQLSCSLRLLNALTVPERDELTGQLGEISAALSTEDCRPLNESEATMFGATLCTLLHVASTRLMGMKALYTIARGPQGRSVMLLECSEVDKMNRSPFAKLLQLIFGGPGSTPGLKLSNQEIAIGTDAISIAAGKGHDVFAAPLLKLKTLNSVEESLVALDRQRATPPLGTYRFLAAISFSGEVQPLIARRPALLTLMLEAATNPAELGTLALLTIRNCCFNQGVKSQFCQDTRVLQLLGMILATPPTSYGEAAHVQEAYKRQQLAMTALHALVHNHQRGKPYIRALLQQPTLVGGGRKVALKDLLTSSSSSGSSSPGGSPSLYAAASPLPRKAKSEFQAAMKRTVEALRNLGVVTD
jgi:hypothetical protein